MRKFKSETKKKLFEVFKKNFLQVILKFEEFCYVLCVISLLFFRFTQLLYFELKIFFFLPLPLILHYSSVRILIFIDSLNCVCNVIDGYGVIEFVV